MGPESAVPPAVLMPAPALARASALLRPDRGREESPTEEEELEGTHSVALRGFAAGEASFAALGECPPPSDVVPPPPPPLPLPSDVRQRIAANRAEALKGRRARSRERRRVPVQLEGAFSNVAHEQPKEPVLAQSDLHRWFTLAISSS
eukprot:3760526-Pyramimonas_sp.AAC.1